MKPQGTGRPRLSTLGLRLAMATLLFASACRSEEQAAIAGSDFSEIQADNVLFGMSSYLTTDGVREGQIQADTAYMYADSSKVDLLSLRITFYDEDGRARATVRGRTGSWDQRTDRMVARGDVLLEVHADDRRIESEELHYDATLDKIWSDSATTQTMADGTVTRGTAFESDLEFRNLRIENIRGGARPGS